MEYYRLQELQYVCHRETMLAAWSLSLSFTENSSYSNYSLLFFVF